VEGGPSWIVYQNNHLCKKMLAKFFTMTPQAKLHLEIARSAARARTFSTNKKRATGFWPLDAFSSF
jgi:hypothetical protein